MSASSIALKLRKAFASHQAGALDEAEALYARVIKASPLDLEARRLHAQVAMDRGDPAEAVVRLGRALRISGADPQLLADLAAALQAAGRLGEAAERYEQLLRIAPGHPQVLNNAGVVLMEMGQTEAAIGRLERAAALAPGFVEAVDNLGLAYQHAWRLDDAVACHARALSLAPQYIDALMNLAAAHRKLHRLDDALACYERALPLGMRSAEVVWNRGLVRLLAGDFERGWADYEVRLTPEMQRFTRDVPDLRCPVWRGEPLAGKRLLLLKEQGLGDQIQFVRFAADLAARGATVDAVVEAPLVSLAGRVPGVSGVFVEPPNQGSDHDFWVLMMSVPGRIGFDPIAGPAHGAYVGPPAEAIDQAGALFAPGPEIKVGLVWAGAPRPFHPAADRMDQRRSFPLATYEPLLAVPGVRFYSLQKGDPSAQLREANLPIEDLVADAASFADTAARIAHLDLVISADTSVAHLAAAMGKRVWLLSRADGCWRWMLDRDDSPWYPSLTIYRQARPYDWAPVVARIATDLHQLSLRRHRADGLRTP